CARSGLRREDLYYAMDYW
nr:immunoglobulin heavy chain junction region [Mus musculus]NSM09105.1 immunoglobulin heavy chain junction region [Mus musculus]